MQIFIHREVFETYLDEFVQHADHLAQRSADPRRQQYASNLKLQMEERRADIGNFDEYRETQAPKADMWGFSCLMSELFCEGVPLINVGRFTSDRNLLCKAYEVSAVDEQYSD